jgi:hypothetical protein
MTAMNVGGPVREGLIPAVKHRKSLLQGLGFGDVHEGGMDLLHGARRIQKGCTHDTDPHLLLLVFQSQLAGVFPPAVQNLVSVCIQERQIVRGDELCNPPAHQMVSMLPEADEIIN